MTRRALLASVMTSATLACADETPVGPVTVRVTPNAVACVAGDQVPLTATVTGAAAATTFTALGGAVWVASADRARGVATVACEAAGAGTVSVDAAGARALVPVTVQPPPLGTLRVTVSPTTIALISGAVTTLSAEVASTRPGVTTDVRFATPDTAVATVDSLFGVVRAIAPGTTTVSVVARADRTIRVAVPVTVTRSSTLVTSIAASPSVLSLVVGDSARVFAAVQLAGSAPAGTPRTISYSSSDPAVATVSAAGVVRATGQGVASIFAAPTVAPLLRARVTVVVRVPPP